MGLHLKEKQKSLGLGRRQTTVLESKQNDEKRFLI